MNGLEYWTQRAIQNDARTQKQKDAGIAHLQKAFEDAEAEILRRIEAFYYKYSEDGKVDLADARVRLTPKELSDFRKRIASLAGKASTEEEKVQLDALKRRVYISRQEALLAEIRAYATQLTTKVENEIDSVMKDIVTEQLLHQQFNIEQAIGWGVNFEGLSSDQIQAMTRTGYDGRNYSSKVWYDRDQLVKNMNVMLPQMFLLGKSVQDISASLSKAMNTPRYAAERLVRTEGAHVAAQADMALYSRTGLAEYEFLATLDNRTSEMCAELDGKVFKLKDAQVGVNLPPVHPNCRSTTLPVVDMNGIPEERLAKDADGNYIVVPKDMTYPEWKASLDTRSSAEAVLQVDWKAFANITDKKEYMQVALKLASGSISDDIRNAIDSPEMLKRIRANAMQTFSEARARYIKALENYNDNYGSIALKEKFAEQMRSAAGKMVVYANKVNAIDTKAWEKANVTPLPKAIVGSPSVKNPFTHTTLKEMRRQLRNEYNVEIITLSDAHVKHVYTAIQQLYAKEPELTLKGLEYLPEIGYFSDQDQKKNSNTYAWVYIRSRRMQLNPKFYTERMQALSDSVKESVKTKWHPKGDIYSVFQHEFGHVLDLGFSTNPAFKRENIVERAWARTKREEAYFWRDKYENKTEWRERISRYATKNLMETWAEAWADWIQNGEHASETSKRIVEEFKKEVKKVSK